MFLKQCSFCKIQKPKSEFCKHKKRKDGLNGQCRQCTHEQYVKWASENQEKIRHNSLNRNKESVLKYREKSKAARSTWAAKYYRENKLALLSAAKRRERDNPKKRIRLRLATRMRNAFRCAMLSKPQNTMVLTGCTAAFLASHLESKFKPGMTWDNYGFRGWHIDHIKPCAIFDLTNPAHVAECFHWTNLQPLWWRENIVKGARFSASEQLVKASCLEESSQVQLFEDTKC